MFAIHASVKQRSLTISAHTCEYIYIYMKLLAYLFWKQLIIVDKLNGRKVK